MNKYGTKQTDSGYGQSGRFCARIRINHTLFPQHFETNHPKFAVRSSKQNQAMTAGSIYAKVSALLDKTATNVNMGAELSELK